MQRFNGRQIRVGVLRGGKDDYHNYSLGHGSDLFSFIIENLYPRFKPVDIFVDRNNVWYISGIEGKPVDLLDKIDIVWNTSTPDLHQVVKSLSIPVVGNNAFHFLLEENKNLLKEHMKKINIKVPGSILFPPYQEDFDGDKNRYIAKKTREVWKKFSPPWVMSSRGENKNITSLVAKTFPELVSVFEKLVEKGENILVEGLILGKVVTTHTVRGFRDEYLYHLPAYSPMTLSIKEKEELKKVCQEVFHHIGADHYLKSDFVIHPRTGIHLININSKVDLHPDSYFANSAYLVGSKTSHIIRHILERYLIG